MSLVGNRRVCPADMILQIGSSAHPGLFKRYHDEDVDDIDYIMSFEEFEKYKTVVRWDGYVPVSGKNWIFRQDDDVVEVEIAWPGSSGERLLNYAEASATVFNNNVIVADLNVCLMLKLSHRYLKNSPHFLKTMKDIKILRGEGAKLDVALTDILKAREGETYPYEHPDLDRTKDEFFVDKYWFDHDSLHQAVAVFDEPMYTKFQVSGAEVSCDMDLFDKLSHGEKIFTVYEETAVLALERSFIPFGKDEQWAFEKALEKVCTSITSGRFREFAWDHYDEVLDFKQVQLPSYTSAFFYGVIDGTVKSWKNVDE